MVDAAVVDTCWLRRKRAFFMHYTTFHVISISPLTQSMVIKDPFKLYVRLKLHI